MSWPPGSSETRAPSTTSVDPAEPAPERLLLSRCPVERRMAVLGAHLAWKEHELLGAVAVGVDVHQDLKADLPQAAEAEIRHLDRPRLFIGDDNSRCAEPLHRVCLSLPLLFPA